MEYTIQKLSKIAGITTRTLRYYDEIGILEPARISSSGYRIYGQKEVDRLQQILFYRELGIELSSIKKIITGPSFDGAAALREHHEKLLEKRVQLDTLIRNVEKTIAVTEGRITMSNQEKFKGFKKKLIDENEKRYGEEIRKKYGKQTVEESSKKVMNMSEEDYQAVTKLEREVKDTLAEAFKQGDPTSELAQKAADLHKRWLTYYWGSYSPEAHVGVAQLYVDDERFTAYYDENQPGTAAFLRDAVLVYTKR